MGFLSSFFLFLLPLISIPLIIHLLNRHNVITIEFSTIRFLKILENESIKKLRFLQILLMLIRTIILLLIILMISRPVINGIYPITSLTPESTISVILIDDSISTSGFIGNKNRIDMTIDYLYQIVNNLMEKQQLEIYMLNKGLIYKGIPADLPMVESLIKYSYLQNSISKYLQILSKPYYNNFTNKELYIVSDNQMVIYEDVQSQDLIGWSLYSIKLDGLNSNIGIINAHITNKVIIPNSPFNFKINLINNGLEDVSNSSIKIFIDSVAVAQQNINIDKGNKISLDFKLVVDKIGYSKIHAVLSKDDNIFDNNNFTLIYIPELINIILVSDNIGEFQFIKKAITTIKHSNKLFSLSEISINELNFNILSTNDIAFISGFSVAQDFFNELEQFMSIGGHIALFPNSNDSDLQGVFPFISTEVLSGFTDLNTNSFIKSDMHNITDDKYKGFIKTESKNFNIKINKYANIPITRNTTIGMDKGLSFLTSTNYENGYVYIYSVSPTIYWSDFPLKGSFIPIIHNSILSSVYSDSFTREIPSKWTINGSHTVGLNTIKIEHDNQIYNSPNLIKNGYTEITTINKPGYYALVDILSKNQLAYNINKHEIQSPILSKQELKRIIGREFVLIDNPITVNEQINSSKRGVETWRYILYLLIAFISIEMIISNGRQQKNLK